MSKTTPIDIACSLRELLDLRMYPFFEVQLTHADAHGIFVGHDMESLLFHFLDEWLFVFSAEPFFIARVSAGIIVYVV